jgi:hypothetical protein
MGKCANIYSYMKRPLVIYDFVTAPFWISLYSIWGAFDFLLSVQSVLVLVSETDLHPFPPLGVYQFQFQTKSFWDCNLCCIFSLIARQPPSSSCVAACVYVHRSPRLNMWPGAHSLTQSNLYHPHLTDRARGRERDREGGRGKERGRKRVGRRQREEMLVQFWKIFWRRLIFFIV